MDDCEAGITGATRDLLEEVEGLEQSAIDGSPLYLDGAAFKTIAGFSDHPEGGERLYASSYPTIDVAFNRS